jgi:hypothetical protein
MHNNVFGEEFVKNSIYNVENDKGLRLNSNL